ncbi:hypothetical protein [[Eubacterium] hominis]|uniref:hypothetical protein n=1 Tax=[Eubacterium] hominis TaxID=2764325 RepID=UPI003A4D5624
MNKKMVAPILIGILVTGYFLLWIALILWSDRNGFLMIMLGIPMTALLFLWIHVVKERIDEIRSGEEDDLSQY